MTKNSLTLPLLIAIVMLLLAIPSIWPYSYYQVLRWAVAGTAVFAAYDAFERGTTGWLWGLAGIAILFNRIAPISLDNSTWIVIARLSLRLNWRTRVGPDDAENCDSLPGPHPHLPGTRPLVGFRARHPKALVAYGFPGSRLPAASVRDRTAGPINVFNEEAPMNPASTERCDGNAPNASVGHLW